MTDSLPCSARTVVIGGGIMGCSTAYHLCALGIRDVVLLERKQLTSGTTWHSAAQVRQLRSSRNLTQLIKDSVTLYSELETETGQATGWYRTGSVSIATNPDRLTHIRRQAALARLYGVEAEEIGPADVKRMWPLANTDDVIGAIYSPSDGRVNPSDACAALIKGARAGGLAVFEDTAVTGFDKRNHRIVAVRTDRGRIACDSVVLCAGLWSGALGDLADTRVPVQPCEHFYLLTKPMDGIEGHLPTLSDHDGHLYIRDDVGGLLVGCFEPGGKVIRLEDLPRDFAFGLLDEDWDHFEPMMRNALHRIPALESAEVRMLLNGPESFTPDGSFLLGPSPDVEGLYLGCGMNSVGIATGGGAGKALATWIADGASPVDLDEAHPARFHPLECAGNALLARAPEVLGQHYAIAYPGREPETARDLKHGPVHERQAAAGARFGQRFGWERPLYFDPEGSADGRLTFDRPGWFQAVERECRAAHGRVALFDQSSFGKIRVTGPDAEAFLQRVCANDMARPPGRTIYTSLLNDRGGIESDLTALRLAEAEYLLLPGTNRLCRDLAWLRRHRANDDIGITDQTDDYAILGLMGPDSRAVLSALTGADLGNAAFPYFAHRPMEIADCPVRASRLSYVGELGWELTISAGHADRVFRSIMAAGEPFGITLAGAYAQTALRIEKRFLAIGHDIGPDTTPLEAGIGFAVKLDSGIDFIGRDALLRQSDNGTGVRLVTLMLEDRNAVPLGHEPILHGGVHVGQVTSAAFGHRVGAAVALGYVSTRVAVNDRCVQVDIAGQLHSARVLLRPAYDPKGTRMRADA